MNLLDVIIILFIILQVVRWLHVGFTRRIFSLVGFWVGIIIGAGIAPFLIQLVDDPLIKLLVTLFIVLIIASITGTLGRLVGDKIARMLQRFNLRTIDVALGSAFSVAATLIIVWLLAAIVSNSPYMALNRQIRGSALIQSMNQTLPPVPDVLSRISTLINPSGFPQVFIGPEPQPVEPVNPPSSAEIAAALKTAGESTVRIESTGCQSLSTGSGFVAADNLVITNAHVVAGMETPTVVDVDGRHQATTVLFDPDLDVAILRTDGLAGDSLPLEEADLERGTTATTLGYPGGGRLEAVPAAVLRQILARGRNIYGQDVVTRNVYELQTKVDSGNSGGPVVRSDGTVVGMIFARSETQDNIGYALTSAEIIPLLNQARNSSQPVSTGSCLAQR